MEKVRFFVLLGAILSGCVLLAMAAESVEDDKPGQAAKPQENVGPATVNHAGQMEEMSEGKDAEGVDSNSPEARMAKAWREFEQASNSEARQMTDLDTEKRLRLSKAALRQTEAELNLIKLVAEQEGAAQTVAMIDKMIETRSAKLAEDVDDARNARREEMMKEREERRKALEEKRKSRREQTGQ